MNKNTYVEEYAIGLITEEFGGETLQLIGRVMQLCGKGLRFGLDTPGIKDPLTGIVDLQATARSRLEELGDVIAAIRYSCKRGVFSEENILRHMNKKLDKLLSEHSVDNLGRKLAP